MCVYVVWVRVCEREYVVCVCVCVDVVCVRECGFNKSPWYTLYCVCMCVCGECADVVCVWMWCV